MTRADSIRVIAAYDTELLMRATIDHFAIPAIEGISLEYISQETFNKLGGSGQKPPPLSLETKNELYRRIDQCLREKFYTIALSLVTRQLQTTCSNYSEQNLAARVRTLSLPEKTNPDYAKFTELVQNHLCLHTPLNGKTLINPMNFHNAMCSLLNSSRATIFEEAKLREVIPGR